MIGREAYANPLLFAPFDRLFHLIVCISMKHKKRKTPKKYIISLFIILFRYLSYVARQLVVGVSFIFV